MEGVIRHRKRQQELEHMRQKKKKNLKSHGDRSPLFAANGEGERELEEGEIMIEGPLLSLAVGSSGSTGAEIEDKSAADDTARADGEGPGADTLVRDKFVELFGKELRFQCEVNSDSHELKGTRYLTPQHLTSLILWCLSNEVPSPKWVSISNRPLLQRFVLVILEGCSRKYIDHMPVLSSHTKVPANIKDSKHLLMYCVDDGAVIKSTAGVACRPSDISHPVKILRANNFPFDAEGFVRAPKGAVGVHKDEDALVAVDCEMCQTELGLELTRLTAVDHEEKVLLDVLVKPSGRVTDYLTEYSGMTKEILDGAVHSLEDAQKALFEFVDSNTYLIGHSLENDLVAMKMIHDKIIDTSICFPNPNMKYKYSLRSLAKNYLGLDIQCNGARGHNSVEDAATAMKLVQLKLQKGAKFGLRTKKKWKSLFEVLHANTVGKDHIKCSVVDHPDVLKSHGSTKADIISGGLDRDREMKAVKAIAKSKFTSVRFCALEDGAGSDESVMKELALTIDGRISNVWKSLPADSPMVTVSVGAAADEGEDSTSHNSYFHITHAPSHELI